MKEGSERLLSFVYRRDRDTYVAATPGARVVDDSKSELTRRKYARNGMKKRDGKTAPCRMPKKG